MAKSKKYKKSDSKKASAKKPEKDAESNFMMKLMDNKWKVSAGIMAVLFAIVFIGPSLSGMFVTPSGGDTLEGLVLTIITDDSCELCDYSYGEDYFTTNAPDMTVRTVSFDSAEGQSLLEEMRISAVPAFVFTDDIEDISIFSQLQTYLTKVGDKYTIIPAWVTKMVDPSLGNTVVKLVSDGQSPTIEQTTIAYLYSTIPNVVLEEYTSTESTGQDLLTSNSASAPLFIYSEQEGTSDVVDALNEYFSGSAIPQGCSKVQSEASSSTLNGMDILTFDSTLTDLYTKTDVPKLEFFVMSFCPYGNLAEDIIEPVFDLFGEKVDIIPRYIVSADPSQADGYRSLHGPVELHQNVRELCVFYDFGEQAFWDFTSEVNEKCSSQNADTCWEPIAQAQGLDVNAIKTCEATRTSELMDNEIELTTLYGVTGSPTMIINGEKYLGQRTSEDLKTALCCAFSDAPSECDEILSSATQAASGSC